MKSKKKIIAIIACLVIVIAAGIFFGVKYYNQKQLEKKLDDGIALIESYLEDYSSKETKEDKEAVYAAYIADEKLNDILATCSTEAWKSRYDEAKTTMYDWVSNYYTSEIESAMSSFEETEKGINDCENVSSEMNNLLKEVSEDTVLSENDITSISSVITENIDITNSTLEEIVSSYNEKYESLLVDDIESASKSDLNTAIESLTALSTEISELSESHFSELNSKIESTVSDYNGKVEEIEAEEAAAAAERAKKEAAQTSSNNSTDSNSSSSSNTTSTSTSTSNEASQSSWSITATFYVDADGCMVTFNAPQVIYDAYYSGKDIDWCKAVDGSGLCVWGCGVGTVWYCDRNGNVVRSEAA